MNSFTYIIRSDSRILPGTPENCQIQLRGLPTKYKSFHVEVLSFHVQVLNDVGTKVEYYDFLELTSNNFSFINGYDTRGNALKTVAATVCNQGNSLKYKVNNFNGQYINFQVIDDELNNDMNVNNWIVILEMTGIEE
jgi:hypothetical protein